MSFLKDVNDDEIESSGDYVGGSYTVPSDIYEGVVDVVYFTEVDSGAVMGNIIIKVDNDGKEQTITQSGVIKSKEGKVYSERNGNKYFLPFYDLINDLTLFTTERTLKESSKYIQEKLIKRWSKEEGEAVEQETDVLTSVIGKPVRVVISLNKRFKQVKNSFGKYEDTDKEIMENNIQKFVSDKGFTVNELKKGVSEPEYLPAWLEANKDKVIDRTKTKGKKSSSSSSGEDKPKSEKKSLFGRK